MRTLTPFPAETLGAMRPVALLLGQPKWDQLIVTVLAMRAVLPLYSEKTQVALIRTASEGQPESVTRFIAFLALSKHALPSFADVTESLLE